MNAQHLNRTILRGVVGIGALVMAAGAVVTAQAATGSAYFHVGRQLVEHGDARLGIQYVATALAIEPNNFVTQTYFVALLDQDRFRDDLAVLAAVRPILPQYPPVIERTAKLLEGRQQEGEAEALYEKWRALRPDSAEAQARAGEHYRFAGKDQEALDAFSDYLNVVQESDYAVRRIAESAARIATTQAAAMAILTAAH
jgi:tetratricopeptide (TPR) repeat protein